MESYQQANRPLTVSTPLGPDTLLLVGLSGTEALSQLFRFRLELIATNQTDIPFEKMLGRKLTAHVKSPGGKTRHFNGICCRMAQGGRDPHFTTYQADVVPEAWFLTRKAQSRIFQSKTVPQILQELFEGLSISLKLKGKYEPRDYCVQYRETDFNFASRLMEEEGIFYFFTHSDGEHTMILGDSSESHPDVPFGSQTTFAAQLDDNVDEERIHEWAKAQELRSMKVTLWDHCFELPHKHLEAETQIMDSVQVGTKSHTLKLGKAEKLELYDWPGEYAQRFDGISPGGEERPSDIQKIFEDNRRTAEIRIQEEAAGALEIAGAGKLRQLTAGHRFSLTRHFDADGSYILTSVHHSATLNSNYRTGNLDEFLYRNTFTCIPAALPYRPARRTPKPVVQGTQTAVVVGPKGEELYTDKYGRVKVQFHWDRDGKHDENSSCWVRVSQPIAGKRWGTSFWPRVGQEVIVDYLEGDPDQPIIVGTVYNADQMPPYLGDGPDDAHKDDNKISGFKSNTSTGGSGFNELRFDDNKDKQQVFLHAERNLDVRVKNDAKYRIYGNTHRIIGWEKDGDSGGSHYEEIYQDEHRYVRRHQVQQIGGNFQFLVGKGPEDGGNVDIVIEADRKELIRRDSHEHIEGTRRERVDGNQSLSVKGDLLEQVGGERSTQVGSNRSEQIGGDQSLNIGGNFFEKTGMNHAVDSGMEIHLKAGMRVVIEAGAQLTLKGPGGFVDIGPAGVAIQGTMVLINSGGAAGAGSGSNPNSPMSPEAPSDAGEAQPTTPEKADNAKTGQKSSS
ncbi:type VI secretion system Vgr family protein [Tautonia rosea]|uniref:type VI secretion system Vgr family protein n=1 Tax=Tautonia rosea TaxID=2728037 RepID=UPI001475FA40|nr:type VI secretion system tip protein TssI/VgrG [Tautonia rosea]